MLLVNSSSDVGASRHDTIRAHAATEIAGFAV